MQKNHNQLKRPIEFCSKCKEMIIGYRQVVGFGWKVCKCDEVKKPVEKSSGDSFIPKFD